MRVRTRRRCVHRPCLCVLWCVCRHMFTCTACSCLCLGKCACTSASVCVHACVSMCVHAQAPWRLGAHRSSRGCGGGASEPGQALRPSFFICSVLFQSLEDSGNFLKETLSLWKRDASAAALPLANWRCDPAWETCRSWKLSASRAPPLPAPHLPSAV